MKIVFAIIVFIISHTSFCQTKAIALNKNFIKSPFSIKYPSEWTLDTGIGNGIEFIIFSPMEGSSDRFRENVNLLIQDLQATTIDLEKFYQISEEQIKGNAKNLEGFSAKKMKSVSTEYYNVKFSMTVGTNTVMTAQYYFVRDKKAYVLTFSSEAGKLMDVGQRILDSFSFSR
ncbi:MAG: hypothetical protein EOO06_20080 [Chitinophagaceae bacterium]|nr:MAG: hypothetical protein EOO06_20080 [Chitinophagaceae bacterium]